MLTRPNKYWLFEANPHPMSKNNARMRGFLNTKHTEYIYVYVYLPEFWSRTSWMALPPSSCLMWESDHVIRKSWRNVAGLASATGDSVKNTTRIRKRTILVKNVVDECVILTMY